VEQTGASSPLRAGLERGFESVAEFAKLERVLAFFCLFIPVLLIAFDDWTIRDSISDYYDMVQNQIFYVPLTIAAMLFIVNGTVKEQHRYNTYLGVALAGVLLFNQDDARWIHVASAVAFFAGNAAVIYFFSRGTPRRFKLYFLAGIAVAMGAFLIFDWFTLFWAEWFSFALIAVHYILDSLEKVAYEAAPRPQPVHITKKRTE